MDHLPFITSNKKWKENEIINIRPSLGKTTAWKALTEYFAKNEIKNISFLPVNDRTL